MLTQTQQGVAFFGMGELIKYQPLMRSFFFYTQTSSSVHFMPGPLRFSSIDLANHMIPSETQETHLQSIWSKERKYPRLSFTTSKDLFKYLPKTCMLNNHKALLFSSLNLS